MAYIARYRREWAHVRPASEVESRGKCNPDIRALGATPELAYSLMCENIRACPAYITASGGELWYLGFSDIGRSLGRSALGCVARSMEM